MKSNFQNKDTARKVVWDRLQAEGLARFPFPPHGRIPNFTGAEQAAKRLFDRAPNDFADLVAPLPDGIELLRRAARPLDLVVTFSTSLARLERRVDELEARLAVDGAIWTAWPKKSSGVATDITEDRLREVFLPPGLLVDVKVCAIDETWSGLKFVIRKERRAERGS